MKATIPLQLTLLIAALIPLGCSTPQTRSDNRPQTVEKPKGEGHMVTADPRLEPFLVSHGFHLEEREIYSRQYRTLKEAGQDLGTSLLHLPIPPNGPPFLEDHDVRVFYLQPYQWWFAVLAKKGRTLDDPDTPCTVSASLVQVQ